MENILIIINRQCYCWSTDYILCCLAHIGRYSADMTFFLLYNFTLILSIFWKHTGVSRGKGQDLFLRSFYESLQIIQEQRLQVSSIHAVVVGSDMNAQPKFEKQLRDLVKEKKMQDRVHFVNKTLNVIPYLAAVDVLVQNSQVCYYSIAALNCLKLFKYIYTSLWDLIWWLWAR